MSKVHIYRYSSLTRKVVLDSRDCQPVCGAKSYSEIVTEAEARRFTRPDLCLTCAKLTGTKPRHIPAKKKQAKKPWPSRGDMVWVAVDDKFISDMFHDYGLPTPGDKPVFRARILSIEPEDSRHIYEVGAGKKCRGIFVNTYWLGGEEIFRTQRQAMAASKEFLSKALKESKVVYSLYKWAVKLGVK